MLYELKYEKEDNENYLRIFVEKKDDIMKLCLAKVRDGTSEKELTYNVNINLGQFVYVPSEKDGLGGQAVDDKYANRYKTKDEDVF